MFTINIGDVDEFDTGAVTDINATANSVVENAANGTVVGVQASAADADATNNTITYSLFNNDGGRFAIDANTGVVTVAGAINREADGASRNITIRASSADGSYTDQVFSIAIVDADEFDVTAPTDINASVNAVNENSAIGTSVGVQASAADADATTNTVTYSLFDSDGGNFAIDANTGIVTTAAALNRETLGASRNITVRATSTDGSTADTAFTININDLDEFDISTISDLNNATNSVAENAANGTTVGVQAFASDADATTNTITYSLDDNAGGRFTINSSTGVVTVADGTLLDYEAATSHNITVRATSADTSFSTQSITINLTDVNEGAVSAVSDSNAAANTVLENTSNGTTVGLTGLATDPDGTDVVTYSLDSDAGGRFAINSSTGIVTVAGAIDREVAASYNITIRATSSDSSTTTQVFTINIGDVDEFDVTAPTDANATANAVNENSAVGTIVGVQALAADADATVNTVTYSLVDNDGGNFSIDSNTGIVTTAAVLDRETLGGTRNITVRATSADGSTADTVFAINLNNVNEGPVAVSDTVIAVEAGGMSNGVAGANPTGNVLSNDTDVDAGDTKTVTGVTAGTVGSASGSVATIVTGSYGSINIAADGSYSYTVDNSSAAVQALRTPAETLIDVFTYTIQDTGGLTSTTQITITIQGANDTPFDLVAVGMNTNENAANGTIVGSISGNDSDSGDTPTYSLTNDANGRFAINSATGVVTVADSSQLNFEAATSHNVTVRVTDLAGATYDESFTITLNDMNEFSVTTPIDSNASVNQVAENSALGTAIGITAAASDTDATNNSVTYSLVNNDGGRFVIDNSTGIVTLAGAIDREADGAVRSITVRATSADGSAADQVFNINVIDVDEFDVTVPNDSVPSANAVNENCVIGSLVGVQIVAFDSDATNSSISYSLDDNAGGRFQIDANTGIVTTAGALNYEAANSHSIIVRATSADGSFMTANFVIAVNDVNERPVATADAYSTTYSDTLHVGAAGLISNDSDVDGNTLTATLVNNPSSGTLILLSDGSFTYIPTVPFVGSVTFQYTVNDGSLTSDIQTVTINVMPPGAPPPNSGGGGGSSGAGGSSGSGAGGDGGKGNDEGESHDKGEHKPQLNPLVGAIYVTQSSTQSLIELANPSNDQAARAEGPHSSVSALNLDNQHFAALNFQESNSILSSSIRLSESHSAVARLNAEQAARLEQELVQNVDAFARLDVEKESPMEVVAMQGVELIAKTAIGSGVVVWVMHISQVMAALLAASSAWTHIDPLSILNASKEALTKDSSDIAETLFDNESLKK